MIYSKFNSYFDYVPKAAPSIAAITGTGSLAKSSNVFLSLETNGPTSSSRILDLSFKSAPLKQHS